MWETWVWSLGWEYPWKGERPGEFHGLYSPWGHKESNTTECLSLSRDYFESRFKAIFTRSMLNPQSSWIWKDFQSQPCNCSELPLLPPIFFNQSLIWKNFLSISDSMTTSIFIQWRVTFLYDNSSTLAWRMPRTEEPGGLPSMGSHRVRHDWSDLAAAAEAHASKVMLKIL